MGQDDRRSPLAASLAALSTLAAAITCCLPVGTMLVAAGAAGASAVLDRLRPWLMGLSVAAVAFGFWQMRRAKQCRRNPGIVSRVLLWTSAVMLIAFLAFPQATAGFFADLTLGAGRRGSSPVARFDLGEFQRAFDDAADRTRVVVLLSPG
jgi:hypothetical protein